MGARVHGPHLRLVLGINHLLPLHIRPLEGLQLGGVEGRRRLHKLPEALEAISLVLRGWRRLDLAATERDDRDVDGAAGHLVSNRLLQRGALPLEPGAP